MKKMSDAEKNTWRGVLYGIAFIWIICFVTWVAKVGI
jgi:hypothetical protein